MLILKKEIKKINLSKEKKEMQKKKRKVFLIKKRKKKGGGIYFNYVLLIFLCLFAIMRYNSNGGIKKCGFLLLY